MTTLVSASGTFELGGTTTVNRLGYGAMQLTGDGVWGPPKDPDEAIRVLQRAVAEGVNLIDTADSYGPFVAEELIFEALHPYPDDLVIATKAGLTRAGPGDWRPVGRPEYLRQQCELSLRHLHLEQIELFQLHRIDPKVPVAESVGELKLLQEEGKIRHIGLSEVTIAELGEARQTAESRSRISTTSPTARPRTCSTTARPRGSRSSRGSRWRPASSPPPAVRWTRSPQRSAPARRSWRWPGCCAARR